MRPPLLYHVYVVASAILVPFFTWIETRKLRRAGVPVHRAHEKLGHATLRREGVGPLVWFHAASVGESLSVLSVITEMGKLAPRAQFLITSGTATSAELVAKRLPPRTVHQFAPLDAPGPVKRFLRHWHPEAVVFVESELWPQMLSRARDIEARMVLVNARLSEKSRNAWARRPKTAGYILGLFDLIMTQNDEMAEAMIALGAHPDKVAPGINLKSLAPPLEQHHAVLAQIRTNLQGRPVWVAASTHKGEEKVVLNAHKELLRQHPDLLLLLAPRHPDRSEEIARLVAEAGLSCSIRSAGAMPDECTVYLADTLGELGNWFVLSDAIFLGGGLTPMGGHNPYEVAQMGRGVISGPEVFNFSESYAEMERLGAIKTIKSATELAAAVDSLLSDTDTIEQFGRAARSFVRDNANQLESIAARLVTVLEIAEQP